MATNGSFDQKSPHFTTDILHSVLVISCHGISASCTFDIITEQDGYELYQCYGACVNDPECVAFTWTEANVCGILHAVCDQICRVSGTYFELDLYTSSCTAGTYGDNCVECPLGYYCPTDGLCFKVPCPDGSYCPPGSIEVGLCPKGSYCENHVKVMCEPGTYCPLDGLTEPKPCPPGSYCDLSNLTETITCPVGSFCDEIGMTNAKDCPPGQY